MDTSLKDRILGNSSKAFTGIGDKSYFESKKPTCMSEHPNHSKNNVRKDTLISKVIIKNRGIPKFPSLKKVHIPSSDQNNQY